jgi:hypothetical protein
MTNYIYLLQEREFIKTNEKIYKVGMTQKENFERFNQYPKGSVLLFQIICHDCKNMEVQVIKQFKEKFIQRKDIGSEYFEGNYKSMIDIIYSTVKSEEENVTTEIKQCEQQQMLSEEAETKMHLKDLCKKLLEKNMKLNKKVNKIENTYICETCNKSYASIFSLSNHKRISHADKKDNKENVKKSLTCEFCYKTFNNRPAKCIHKKTCKPDHTEINEVETLKNTVNELKILDNKQIHFNKNLPEYSNIFITNMKDDLAYVFDGKQFISVRKNEILNELIDIHTKEINFSLEKNKCDMNQKCVGRLEKFLNMLNDDDTKFTDQENKRTYPSYKAYKINSIKLMIYNNSEKFNLSKKLNQTAEE